MFAVHCGRRLEEEEEAAAACSPIAECWPQPPPHGSSGGGSSGGGARDLADRALCAALGVPKSAVFSGAAEHACRCFRFQISNSKSVVEAVSVAASVCCCCSFLYRAEPPPLMIPSLPPPLCFPHLAVQV